MYRFTVLTLIGKSKLFHSSHMHLELALIGEEVLAVTCRSIALIGAA